MKGRGWKLRVWENLGWHYCVENCGMAVHQSLYGRKGSYHAYLSSDPSSAGGGAVIWHDGNHYADPNEAVRVQIEEARKVLHHYRACVDAIDYAVNA